MEFVQLKNFKPAEFLRKVFLGPFCSFSTLMIYPWLLVFSKIYLHELSKVAKNYPSYPLEYDDIPSSHKVDVKPVRVQQLSLTRNPQQNSFTHRPCCLCTFKGFEDQHYPFGRLCGTAKLSSPKIINVISRLWIQTLQQQQIQTHPLRWAP